jgi:S-adenosyl-L-methionine hydrolase (adenosine-forming)
LKPVQVITLLTDFGLADWFVGTMKGVILSLNPRARIVDITHAIPAGDIRAGSFALMVSCRYFPPGTVHVAVVDPGVGSARKAIAVQTANYTLLGPDNGVLSWALRAEKIKAVRLLENEECMLSSVSHTFHGRDIFAPVAAHLARGVPPRKLGPAAKDFVRLPWPEPARRGRRIHGEVIYIDRFGNAITSIGNEFLPRTPSRSCEIQVGARRYKCPLKEFYQAAPRNTPVAVPGSCGLLEIAVNGDSAEKLLGLRVGTKVLL